MTAGKFVASTLAVASLVAGNPVPEDCLNAVSTTIKHDNDYCLKECTYGVKQGKDIHDLTDFKNGNCMIESWSIVDGRVNVDECKCFNQWVYGYSEPMELASMTENVKHTQTPALCQSLCQATPGCVAWSWASDLLLTSEPTHVHSCIMKNAAQVEGALDVITQKDHWPEVGSTMNTEYCNYGMEHECATNHYECLKCNNLKRCVWRSDMHVSGRKHCIDHDVCQIKPTNWSTLKPQTTSLRPTTTKATTTKATTTPKPTTTTKAPTTTCKSTTTKRTTKKW